MKSKKSELIFVCSPFEPTAKAEREKEISEMTDMALRQCRRILEKGNIPLAPHLYCQMLREKGCQMVLGMEMDLALSLVPEVVELQVIGNQKTEQMKKEIQKAYEKGIPVYYYRDPRQVEREEQEAQEDTYWRKQIREDMRKEGML
jgi:hypothetical protein